MLVKVKHANIINIAAKEEIIPELLQSNCSSKKIFEHVSGFLDNPEKIKYCADNGYDYAYRYFTYEHVNDRLTKILKENGIGR